MPVADVIVVGGGCHGASAAFWLAARHRRRVVLLERHTVGSGPTGRSSAIVRQHYSYEPLVRLAQRSHQIFASFETVVGGTADFRRTGFLMLVPPGQEAILEANVALQQRLGVTARVLGRAAIARLDGRLRTDDVGAGAYEPDSGYADGHATAIAFAAAARRGGPGGDAGPQGAGRGGARHRGGDLLWPDDRRSRAAGGRAVGEGTDFAFIERVSDRLVHRMPAFAGVSVKGGYASLYDVTLDWQPVLGAVPGLSGLYVAAGFSGHGFKLSPAVGEAMAAIVTEGWFGHIDLGIFRPSRFAEGALIHSPNAHGIVG